jgi:hypothetical protein
MSCCAETVEDDNCLWKQMEKWKTISRFFSEQLSILLLVALVQMNADSCLNVDEGSS